MKISNKRELAFSIMADNMMNTGKFNRSLKSKILGLLIPQYKILRYLKLMRKCQYYDYKPKRGGVLGIYYRYLYAIIGGSLGYSIGFHVFGYGLTLNHYGTIIVGDTNRIGNFALIDTCTNIGDAKSIIGNYLYVGPGVKIIKHVELGDNVMIGANSVVNKSFSNGNVVIAGVPAEIKKTQKPWYIVDKEDVKKRVEAINNMKMKMNVFQNL